MSDHVTDSSEGQGRPRMDSEGYLVNIGAGARVVGLERDIMN